MTSRNDPGERLERLVDRAARDLPLRHAPAALESRVLREIERRSLSSASQQGVRRGPLVARAALIAGCCACAALVPLGFSILWARLVMAAASPHVERSLDTVRQAREAGAALGSLFVRLARAIPSDWLVGGLLAAALLYASLFALLALGYSMLYAAPGRSGSHPT